MAGTGRCPMAGTGDDDALGRDAFVSFRPVLTELHIGIGKRAPTERRRRVYALSGTLPVGELVPGKKRPDIHSAVTAQADDALGHDAFLSFRPVITRLHNGIGKRAPTERRRRVYAPSGTLPVGEKVPRPPLNDVRSGFCRNDRMFCQCT